jgi:acyl-CoA synthetase (AMP-forming)/AMP-acid ligase II
MSLRTLGDLLHESARQWPDKVAIGVAGRDVALSYAEIEVLSDHLAAQLRLLGVGESDTIALFSDNCVEYALALFAVTSAGAALAPLDPALAPTEVASRLAAVHAKATIVPAHLCDRFVAAGAKPPAWKLVLDRSAGRVQATIDVAGPAVQRTARPPGPGDVALLMCTSGTTSAPKVVPLTHANLSASIEGICGSYRLSPDDATLLVMPLFHGHGLIAGLLATLATGGAAYVPSGGRFSAHTFWNDMADIRATWYTAVPTMHQILLARAKSEYPKDHRPMLRFIRSCSAPLATKVLHDLEFTFSAPVLPAYGMTETAHQASSNPLPTDGRCDPSSVGLATGVAIRVLGPDGHVVDAGKGGEVCVRGPSVTSGYLDNPEANAASFVDGWFHTGDLGYENDDGYLFLTGRIKEIINRGGEKISPARVDAVLLTNPKIQDAISFGVPDEKYGEEIDAAVILKPGETASEQELERYARADLSAFEVPKRFYFVTDFPRTEKGTADRRKLAAMFTSGARPA